MTWFKVDDQLHAHPKAREAGLEAMGLWLLAGSHCASYLTDGRVDLGQVLAICAATGRPSRDRKRAHDLAAKLVAAGLWEVAGVDQWQYHDWSKYQPTKEAVEAERRQKQEAGQKSAASRRGTPVGTPVERAVPAAAVLPIPSRSDLSLRSRSSRARDSAEPRSPEAEPEETLMPPDLPLTDEARAVTATIGVLDVDGEWIKYRGHYAGKSERRRDWYPGFSKWCVEAKKIQSRDRSREEKFVASRQSNGRAAPQDTPPAPYHSNAKRASLSSRDHFHKLYYPGEPELAESKWQEYLAAHPDAIHAAPPAMHGKANGT